MQLLCMCCGLMQFLSESLPLYLLGVVVLRTLYSPLYNWSLTVSSDPCQSSVSDEHMYMVGEEKHNHTIMTLNNSWFVPCVNWQSSVHLCRPCNSASVVTLRALRTGSVAFEAILWQYLNQLYDKWRSLKWLFTVVTWSPTLNVTSFLATPPSSLVVPSPAFTGYISAINAICGICVSKISWLFPHHYVPFQMAQLFIRWNSWYLFPKC